MKQTLAIILLLITACYVLPVNVCMAGKSETACKYAAEKSCDETPEIKKDNTKELFNNSNDQYIVAYIKPVSNNISPLLLSSFCGFVETPPPDFL